MAGLVTQEAREGGQRVGFRLRDLSSGVEGWLARKEGGKGPRVGSYTVDSGDLERIAVKALEIAVRDETDVVFVDEIGPMEMTSPAFRRALSQLFSSGKLLVATLKYGSRYEEVERARMEGGVTVVDLTRENRDAALTRITSMVDSRIVAEDSS